MSEEYALPNQDAIAVTLCRLLEDVPEFIFQAIYLYLEWDTFTACNLFFTVIVLFCECPSSSSLLCHPNALSMGLKTTLHYFLRHGGGEASTHLPVGQK